MKGYIIKSKALLTVGCAIMLLIGCEEETDPVKLFEAPVFGAFVTNTEISYGESVTFTDTSTLVFSRQWSFPGGSPASSSDSVVSVIYASGGEYEAILSVQHIDNQVREKRFHINVAGPTVQTYGFYSEAPNVTFGHALALEGNNAYTISTVTTEKFEGEKSIEFKFSGEDTWGVQGSLRPSGNIKLDISEYAGGTYNVAIKTSCDKSMLLRLHTNNGTEERAILELDPEAETYGIKRDGEWHQVSIPMEDFVAANSNIDLTAVTHLLVLRSGTPDVTGTDDWDWYIDNFYLELQLESGD